MNPNAAKWDDLKMFLEVARQGSVHAAAKRLRLDHSTVCRRIGRLESLLAVKLFDRSRKGIAVRSEAQGLLKHIEQMDRHAGHLEDAFVRGKSTRRRSSASPRWKGLPAVTWRGDCRRSRNSAQM